jgi:TMEM175 potassium channel family protein
MSDAQRQGRPGGQGTYGGIFIVRRNVMAASEPGGAAAQRHNVLATGSSVTHKTTMNPHKELQRIEAFSDAVFAIACTLLVLEITVPHLEDVRRPGALWPALQAVWPSFVAYVVSFGSIFIGWAGHHRALNVLEEVIEGAPLCQWLVAADLHFHSVSDGRACGVHQYPPANIAMVFYSAALLATNLSANVWWLSVFRPVRLLSESVSKARVRRVTIQVLSGLGLYSVTTVVAYWFPIMALVILLLTQALWVLISVEPDD